MKIYRYVVQYDGGSAPRPFGGVCSLAICKPAIRRTASVGDWIIGVRSRLNEQVVYVMQVAEILPFDQYWNDSRFEDRRPGASPVPDNIYRPYAFGDLVQEKNVVHDASCIENDLSGGKVLVGRRFWYFGASSPVLPDALTHLKPYCRGHSVHINRKSGDTDINELKKWLEKFSEGILGEPIDATDETRGWLSRSQHSDRDSATTTAGKSGCGSRSVTGSSQVVKRKSNCGNPKERYT